MGTKNIIWFLTEREKLIQFRSSYFTAEETLEFISELIVDIEDLLKNEFISQSYTEEFGAYKGLYRIVIKKFRVYYEIDQDNIVILGILFPGEK